MSWKVSFSFSFLLCLVAAFHRQSNQQVYLHTHTHTHIHTHTNVRVRVCVSLSASYLSYLSSSPSLNLSFHVYLSIYISISAFSNLSNYQSLSAFSYLCIQTFFYFVCLFVWVQWHTYLCKLFNTKFIFIQIHFFFKQFSLAYVHSLLGKNISISVWSNSPNSNNSV